jgi:hypothetical protein
MHRRQFIALLGGAAVGWPRAARAQEADRMRRVGVLDNRVADDPEEQARLATFRQGLQELGWTDGRNVRFDYRWAAADADRSRTYAAELVALAPDVILASGSLSVAALLRRSPFPGKSVFRVQRQNGHNVRRGRGRESRDQVDRAGRRQYVGIWGRSGKSPPCGD